MKAFDYIFKFNSSGVHDTDAVIDKYAAFRDYLFSH